ncbi:hypothetical protein E2A64_00915 [Pseudohoeflea suaedae]|uniref:Uncharacterized protein n=1 Tax=Pseudohoeflea suaedae TaxID=877384 RepID=A0A4R5PLC5_9HYPH|nr:hypothetical protein [Pseudohoeflea suaedae]TDH37736.1 hypothetical protein E2A64_00915 [Pseudohoeflea suaedae]
MKLENAKKAVKSRLAQIADTLTQQNRSFTTAEVFAEFNKSVDRLSDEERSVLIGVGARVLAGRLPTSRSAVNWQSPTIAGLGLPKCMRLKLKGSDGKYHSRNYPVGDITRSMIEEHLSAPSAAKEEKDSNQSQREKLKAILDDMKKVNYAEDGRLLDYRG